MSATVGAAIKAYLEAPAMNLAPAYRDRPPEGTKPPYITVAEGIALTMTGLEDGGPATGADATATETVQVDLWLTWMVAKKVVDSTTLPDALSRALHGASLPTAPTKVYGVVLRNRIRLLERDNNIVHYAYTCDVHRKV